MIVSTGRLERMRDVAERTMTDECAITRAVETRDNQGGVITDWDNPEIVATVACRVAPTDARAVEREVGGQIQPQSAWTVTVPAETDVRSTDRIESDGHTYHVVKAIHRTLEIERAVICEMSS